MSQDDLIAILTQLELGPTEGLGGHSVGGEQLQLEAWGPQASRSGNVWGLRVTEGIVGRRRACLALSSIWVWGG